jgi:hypothetical protein
MNIHRNAVIAVSYFTNIKMNILGHMTMNQFVVLVIRTIIFIVLVVIIFIIKMTRLDITIMARIVEIVGENKVEDRL